VAEEATVLIRPGRGDEGARLKEIAINSKAHWGYGLERVREWADQGDFSSETLRKLARLVAEGIGSRLFRQAADHARATGARTMEWEAEPNALGFYEKMGGRYVRDSTGEWGRTLSVMGVDLA
jgi:GNAT superfamily N-acetyltransferase